jgi:phosphatidate cytidylyltransferase
VTEQGRRAPSNLTRRVATAAIGLPIVIAAAWLGGWWFAAFMALVAAAGAIEFGRGWLMPTLSLQEAAPRLVTFAASGMVAGGVHESGRFVPAAALLAGLYAVAGYVPNRFVGPRKPYRVHAWALIYVGIAAATFVLVRDLEGGRDWLLAGALATFAVDTGAYATGRLVGRHKLAPRISPSKTWEGAVGGYAAGVAVFLGLNAAFGTGQSAITMLPVALALPVLSQAGDLFESWMKRRMGIKDSSGLLPGHGGFLDRLDSLLFVMPVLYLFLRWRVV